MVINRLMLYNNVSFFSYFLTLTLPVKGFVELPATLVSELGCHVGIHFNRVRFELYIYIYKYIYIYIYIYTYIYIYIYISDSKRVVVRWSEHFQKLLNVITIVKCGIHCSTP